MEISSDFSFHQVLVVFGKKEFGVFFQKENKKYMVLFKSFGLDGGKNVTEF